MEYQRLVACHECDLLFRKPLLRSGQTASCSRCSATLKGAQGASVPLDRICALTVAALITFCIAQAFPVIQLQTNGMTSEATLFGAVRSLWTGHMRIVATMVLCSAILFPLIELLAFLYVLVPLRFGKVVRHFNCVLRVVQLIRPWGMVEVFMLGVVITIVKMVSMAQVIPGPGLFAFGALTLMLAFLATFDPRVLWSTRDEIMLRHPAEFRWTRVEHELATRASTFFGRKKPAPAAHITARRAGLIACHTCGLVQKHIAVPSHQRCSRCESVLHTRHPGSTTRTSSLLLAAALAYIPANLLPIMHASSLGRTEEDTILGGVAYFWTSGDWPLAVVVFAASVVVPMLKLAILTLQIIAAHRSPDWQPLERARLHRLVERVGRWSMLDVFVVALTVALVHFGSFAVVTAGPGALAFGAVVILTMLASHQFDPRLIWDNIGYRARRGSRR
jgi:paraquat-inducible protein A